jgi:hypothetical protein
MARIRRHFGDVANENPEMLRAMLEIVEQTGVSET